MKTEVDLEIRPVKYEEQGMVAIFMQKHFFTGEPLNVALNRHPTPDEIPFLESVKEGFSFKAVNLLEESEDNVAGVVVSTEMSICRKKKPKPSDEKGLKIRKLLDELDERSKIWEYVNNENHFNIVAVAVDKKYYGHKIGWKLIQESIKLAKTLNYNYVTMECSSFYSSKIATQLGFEMLMEIAYDEYLDENNEQVFKVSKPHTSIKKFVRRL